MQCGGVRILTTYQATEYVREHGGPKVKGISQADIRRACSVGTIPGAEESPISESKTIWLIPSVGMDAWMRAGLPGRHHYQAEQLREAGHARPPISALCLVCGGALADRLVNDWHPLGYDAERNEVRYAWVRGKPAQACTECGYTYQPMIEVSERIEELAAAGQTTTETHPVIVFDPGDNPEMVGYYETCKRTSHQHD